MKYFYFVSFAFNDRNGTGFSSIEISRYKKINSVADINSISTYIESSLKYKQISIINYKLLRVEKE